MYYIVCKFTENIPDTSNCSLPDTKYPTYYLLHMYIHTYTYIHTCGHTYMNVCAHIRTLKTPMWHLQAAGNYTTVYVYMKLHIHTVYILYIHDIHTYIHVATHTYM